MISIVSATLIVDMCSLFPAHAFPPYWVGLAGLANLHYLCIYCSLLLRFGPYSTPHTNWHACCTISSFCPRIHEDSLRDTLQCRAHLCTLLIQSNGRHARIERVGGKNKKIKIRQSERATPPLFLRLRLSLGVSPTCIPPACIWSASAVVWPLFNVQVLHSTVVCTTKRSRTIKISLRHP